jgi:hypothetical protein
MEQGHEEAWAAFTVRDRVLLVIPLSEARILELPADCPVAKPVLLMVAKVVLEEFQVTWLERSWVLLSW